MFCYFYSISLSWKVTSTQLIIMPLVTTGSLVCIRFIYNYQSWCGFLGLFNLNSLTFEVHNMLATKRNGNFQNHSNSEFPFKSTSKHSLRKSSVGSKLNHCLLIYWFLIILFVLNRFLGKCNCVIFFYNIIIHFFKLHYHT